MSSPKCPKLSADAQLAMIPLRNRAAREVSRSAERLVLEIDQTYSRWLGPLPRLLRLPSTRRYEFDGIGLEILSWVDDHATLVELIDRLSSAESLSFHESRTLTLTWLRRLAEKGLVVLGAKTRPVLVSTQHSDDTYPPDA